MTTTRHADSLPTTIFLCVHRGGSSFIANTFADAACRHFPGLRIVPVGSLIEQGQRLEEITLPPTGVLATRVYPGHYDALIDNQSLSGGRLILMRRDPRDVAVSWYYSAAYSHPVPPNIVEAYERRRLELRRLGAIEGIRQHTARDAIAEFRATVRFIEDHPATCQAPYELLVTGTGAWIERVITHLDWPAQLIDELAPAFAAAVASPAREDIHRHRRRVRPGSWQTVFDDNLCALFEREIGDALTSAGYGWS